MIDPSISGAPLAESRCILNPARWHTWMMLPGYHSPYISPIYVTNVTPEKTGGHKLNLSFYNAYYAGGARDFAGVRCRVVKRFPDHMFIDLTVDDPDSGYSAIIREMFEGWLRLADAADKYELDGVDLQDALTWTHFRGRPPVG